MPHLLHHVMPRHLLLRMILVNIFRMVTPVPPSTRPVPPSAEPPARLETVRALDLLGPARKVVIEHRGEHYVLHLTRSGKLLLTK